jgi:hypothetical protein
MANRKTEDSRTRGIILLVVLWVLQSVGRVAFAILGAPEGMGQFLDVPVSHTTSVIMFVMFLFLGVCGFAAAFTLWKKQKCGFRVTIFVSVATIAFDIWGLTIQYTAAIGFIVPTISMLYLYSKKSEILTTTN